MLLGSLLPSAVEAWAVSPAQFIYIASPILRQLDLHKLNEQMVKLHHVSQCVVGKGYCVQGSGAAMVG